MKKNKEHELRSEYKRDDVTKSIRGKYYESYNDSHNLILLNSEVAKAFPDDDAVNNALMSLIKIAKTSTI